MTKGGDCYQAAGRYVIEHPDAVLCHGTAIGRGPIAGVRFGHAWIERDGLVLELANGNELKLPQVVYYKIGRIRNVHRYDFTEAAVQILRAKHWGPWHEDAEDGALD